MKIYFVRHGHPDYANDCLTPLGHKQAAAAAERLADCGIEQIFSSSNGRAMETAEHTAKMLGLDVVPCDFMREIRWYSTNGEPILLDGNPWAIAKLYAAEGKSLTDADWREKEPFCNSKVISCEKTVIDGLDDWLAELGYQREGNYYRVTSESTDRTVAMFSHGGSSSVAMSHIFNIPFPQICGILCPNFTAVTVVSMPNRFGELVGPRIWLANDACHIEGIDNEIVYGN